MQSARYSFFSRAIRVFLPCSAAFLVLAMMTACETEGLLDPSQVGPRPGKKTLVVPILDTLDPSLEQPDTRFADAGAPTAQDLVVTEQDYRIGRNDALSVSIQNLVGPGIETVRSVRVSETGNINLPLLKQPLHALGLTEAQLEDAIANAYADQGVLVNPQIAVTLIEARARTFSILGSVGQVGQYAIAKADFRILDALVLARDLTIPDQQFLYVIRHPEKIPGTPSQPPHEGSPSGPVPSSGAFEPRSDAGGIHSSVNVAGNVALLATGGDDAPASSPTTAGSMGEERAVHFEGKSITIGGAKGETANSQAKTQATQPAVAATRDAFEFNAPQPPEEVRVIRIPLQKLFDGQLQYNIVVRPNDMIIVPPPVIGEYYMGGHVQRTGVYSLNNRKITLKQAVIAAGMLDGMAIPDRTEVIRRIGPNKEIFVRVNLSKIFDGEQPDVYLKPYDQVNVGTNAIAPFLAAARGAFRMTYGFGFLYDRNFAPAQENSR